jgi:hypothetical protein
VRAVPHVANQSDDRVRRTTRHANYRCCYGCGKKVVSEDAAESSQCCAVSDVGLLYHFECFGCCKCRAEKARDAGAGAGDSGAAEGGGGGAAAAAGDDGGDAEGDSAASAPSARVVLPTELMNVIGDQVYVLRVRSFGGFACLFISLFVFWGSLVCLFVCLFALSTELMNVLSVQVIFVPDYRARAVPLGEASLLCPNCTRSC